LIKLVNVQDGSVLDAFNTHMIKLSAAGVTVLVSSGDLGAFGFYGNTSCSYTPLFPASCPYVTSVGTTQGIESVIPDIGTGEMALQVTFLSFMSEIESLDYIDAFFLIEK